MKFRILFIFILPLLLFACVPSDSAIQTAIAETKAAQLSMVDVDVTKKNTCPDTSLPWDLEWIPADTESVADHIDTILEGSGLTGHGLLILNLSKEYGVNPAFALAMFKKEASFAASNTRAYRNNNPGNIKATGECKGLQAGSTCKGHYGENGTDGQFGTYSSMADGIKAYFMLLSAEYKPGSKRDCHNITCIISAYCPATECNVELYVDQITDWTRQYQCQLIGMIEPLVFTSATPTLPETIITKVPPRNTATPTIESSNRADAFSVLQDLVNALDAGDISFFERLIIEDSLAYGSGFAGQRGNIDRKSFLVLLRERIDSHPICRGYTISGSSLRVFTSDWSPAWPDNESGFNFQIYEEGGNYYLSTAYFTPAYTILEVPSVNGKPCPPPKR